VKLAFVTDNHFDEASRFEETIRVHDFIAEDAARRGCEGTLLGGDLYEGKSSIAERNAAVAWVLKMATIGPVVGVKGNHEIDGDLDVFNRLRGRHPIRIHSDPDVDRIGDVLIACVPWPRKASLIAKYGRLGLEESNAKATDYLRQDFRGLAEAMDAHGDAPRIALAHVMIDRATTDHDQPIVGADMAVSLEELGLLRAHFYACGHVHAQQAFRIGDADCIYGGAPKHCNWGEPGPKGYVVLNVEGGRVVGWERVATPATPMALVNATWSGPLGQDDGGQPRGFRDMKREASVSGAEVRVRYAVEVSDRAVASRAAEEYRAELLANGAVSVILEEEVIATTRARVPEITSALTIAEKLSTLWAARGEEIPAPARERLFTKVTALEEEARAAA
jgi:DNA repair exonuclease SbcCD nuclease subunit